MSTQVGFRQKAKKKKIRIDNLKTVLVTVAAIIFAFIFLLPTILTITNSFMSSR